MSTLLPELLRAVGTQAKLMAVSKGQSVEKMRALLELGQQDFGENYVQELIEKAPILVPLGARFHFIGKLQSNKIQKLLPWVSSIHSVDRLELAQKLSRALAERRQVLPIFLQINIDSQETKSGFEPEELLRSVDELLQLQKTFEFKGLMCLPRPAHEGGNPRQAFSDLRILEQKTRAMGLTRGELSMGMSQDYPEALQAGSSWIRVGTLLFGPRAPAEPAKGNPVE